MMKQAIPDSSEALAQAQALAQMLRVDGMEPRLNRVPSDAAGGALGAQFKHDDCWVFACFLSIRIVELVARAVSLIE
jgi:hypothetical protein